MSAVLWRSFEDNFTEEAWYMAAIEIALKPHILFNSYISKSNHVV